MNGTLGDVGPSYAPTLFFLSCVRPSGVPESLGSGPHTPSVLILCRRHTTNTLLKFTFLPKSSPGVGGTGRVPQGDFTEEVTYKSRITRVAGGLCFHHRWTQTDLISLLWGQGEHPSST